MIKALAVSAAFLGCMANNPTTTSDQNIPSSQAVSVSNIYDYKVEALEGGTINFADFKGKKILVVNTASNCAKVSVKGEDMAPIYKWLTQKSQNGVLDAEIKWNFNKFLIDENGNMVAYFPSKITPLSEEITSKL
ncbi:MAG: hypothetical protein EOO06_16940 [Chitinophagaceae bacterium]|nr:MAG: hypothetical protein EOO06_16940 [Chitinophagaceae bacterium]